MMKVRDRIAPVLLGLGLWVVGNGLIGVQSANGQEVSGNFKTPTPTPYTFNVYNNCLKAGQCSRYREDIWGCKPASIFDSCYTNVPLSIAVYKETTGCTMSDPAGTVCDWNPTNGNIVSTRLTDGCEYSSKKTGNGSCAVAAIPSLQHHWKNRRDIQLVSNSTSLRIVRGQSNETNN